MVAVANSTRESRLAVVAYVATPPPKERSPSDLWSPLAHRTLMKPGANCGSAMDVMAKYHAVGSQAWESSPPAEITFVAGVGTGVGVDVGGTGVAVGRVGVRVLVGVAVGANGVHVWVGVGGGAVRVGVIVGHAGVHVLVGAGG